MLDWFARLVVWATGRTQDEHVLRIAEFDRLSVERDKAREDYGQLMKGYQEMNQELQTRLDGMEAELALVKSALEVERTQHRECQRRLDKAEQKLVKLEAQMLTIMQRGTDH